MIILTTVIGYDIPIVLPFWKSLKASGFTGKLVIFADNCPAANFLKSNGADILVDNNLPWPINTRRFFIYKEFLRDVREPVIITDSRDVIFQSNPEENMPKEDVNVFCEYEKMSIGTCPYNSKWMKDVFGLPKWFEKSIICAGVTSGILTEYCIAMWEALLIAPPVVGLDQAIHNHLIYSNRIKVTIWENEISPVYTVGYFPRETISIKDGFIYNQKGLPCMVHQYDRHQNLKGLYHGKW